MERISGPYKGHFIAAYTVANGRSFAGYAKVCPDAPQSVWSTEHVEKLASVSGCRTEAEAMMAAERKARQEIVNMLGCGETSSNFGQLQYGRSINAPAGACAAACRCASQEPIARSQHPWRHYGCQAR